MDVRHAPPARQQRPDVTARLRSFQLPEGLPPLLRNRHVLRIVHGDHEKQPGVGTALMELPRRVQVAGPEAQGGGAAEGAAPLSAQCLKSRGDFGRGRQIREDREVVAGLRAAAQVRRTIT